MPDGTICLTFDFDAISIWLERGMPSPAGLSRGEFGAVAVPRILTLLRSRGIQATFFIPGNTIDNYEDLCKEIAAQGHEIALHGYMHESVGDLDEGAERDVFRRAYDRIERLTGAPPAGNRTPSWDFSDHTIDIMLDLGLLYDSSLMSNDYMPQRCRQGHGVSADGILQPGEETNLIELPVSWSLDDYPHFEFMAREVSPLPGLRPAAGVFANWRDDIAYMQRDFDRGVAVVTCHPQVIGRGHRILGLERWIDECRQLGVHFSRCDAVAQRVQDGEVLGVYQPAE